MNEGNYTGLIVLGSIIVLCIIGVIVYSIVKRVKKHNKPE